MYPAALCQSQVCSLCIFIRRAFKVYLLTSWQTKAVNGAAPDCLNSSHAAFHVEKRAEQLLWNPCCMNTRQAAEWCYSPYRGFPAFSLMSIPGWFILYGQNRIHSSYLSSDSILSLSISGFFFLPCCTLFKIFGTIFKKRKKRKENNIWKWNQPWFFLLLSSLCLNGLVIFLGCAAVPGRHRGDMMLTWQGNSLREPPAGKNEAAQQRRLHLQWRLYWLPDWLLKGMMFQVVSGDTEQCWRHLAVLICLQFLQPKKVFVTVPFVTFTHLHNISDIIIMNHSW